MPITLDEVRRRILIALVSDDALMQTLVLKGGTALALVHEVGGRASVDMDFSIATNFGDLSATRESVFKQLEREFAAAGYVLFDRWFLPKPDDPNRKQPVWWGGYIIEFKLIEKDISETLKGDVEAMRRQAAVVGPDQKRTYTIDISKNEYCASKVKRKLDGYTIYAYSLEMIAIEKLRAICQQMEAYPLKPYRTRRARDFYDVHEIVRQPSVDLTTAENQELFRAIFGAKEVPLKSLNDIRKERDFHAPDWPGVESSIEGEPKDFDYYFDFVCQLVSRLEVAREK